MLLAGGGLLYLGAEWLVKGSAGLAQTFGVPPIVIGLTVVAYGTSAPELVVTLIAAAEGRGAIALGNVIGSNVANIGLILGLTALVRPPAVESGLIRRELPILLLGTGLVPALLWNDEVSRLEGAMLLTGAVAFTLFTVKLARQVTPRSKIDAEAREEVRVEAASGARAKLAMFAAVGLGTLVAGGKLFVDGASGLALDLGMSERLIGLTIVAIGTSLPELAASLVAALGGHSELAVGNIVGSNIFNILLVLGGSALVRPISESFAANRIDLAALVVVTAIGTLTMRGERVISRVEGALLVAIYAGFIALVAAARV